MFSLVVTAVVGGRMTTSKLFVGGDAVPMDGWMGL
jgi:hypothetical protein